MSLRVGIVGFEPAIQRSLEALLGQEEGLEVVSFPRHWSPEHGVAPQLAPQVLVISPPGPDWVQSVHSCFPTSRLLAHVEWHRRDLFRFSPITEFFERCNGYEDLLRAVNTLGGN